jgi:hypothetical protein
MEVAGTGLPALFVAAFEVVAMAVAPPARSCCAAGAIGSPFAADRTSVATWR